MGQNHQQSPNHLDETSSERTKDRKKQTNFFDKQASETSCRVVYCKEGNRSSPLFMNGEKKTPWNTNRWNAGRGIKPSKDNGRNSGEEQTESRRAAESTYAMATARRWRSLSMANTFLLISSTDSKPSRPLMAFCLKRSTVNSSMLFLIFCQPPQKAVI
jgi:hypothetical protein